LKRYQGLIVLIIVAMLFGLLFARPLIAVFLILIVVSATTLAMLVIRRRARVLMAGCPPSGGAQRSAADRRVFLAERINEHKRACLAYELCRIGIQEDVGGEHLELALGGLPPRNALPHLALHHQSWTWDPAEVWTLAKEMESELEISLHDGSGSAEYRIHDACLEWAAREARSRLSHA
jgi:hypothetical protein